MSFATNICSINPSYRADKERSSEKWLQHKKQDDKIPSSLWRVHDKLYNLNNFHHPGGQDWINSTKGMDITEQFESSHLNNEKVCKILEKYYHSDIASNRIVKYTFHKNDFYNILRNKCYKYLSQPNIRIKRKKMQKKVDHMLEILLLLFFITLSSSCIYNSFIMLSICSIILAFIALISHNYLHKRNNWYMYVMDLAMTSSYDWRISHAIIHHAYPNTKLDIEIYKFEPFIYFLPNKILIKSKTLTILYSFIIELFALLYEFIIRQYDIFISKKKSFRKEYLLIYIEFIYMFILLHYNFMHTFIYFIILHCITSFIFIFIGLTAAHHDPLIWHSGDEFIYQSYDFGILQLDATCDRKKKKK